MSEVAIRVENLGKLYHIGGPQARYKTIRESITDGLKAPFRKTSRLLRGKSHGASDLDQTFWALKDVSFEMKQGEVVGIIGRNGAGKSTLLKILSRITEPTEGEVMLRGRVGSLLEVGTGFHPELTGRENTYLNGAILGMSRVEIDRKFDEIVDFSGIEQFIDTPVKHYSSGMQVRLAFSVAAHLEPEILLVDEVLAVGDSEFQKKCLGKMDTIATEGRTVILVSHNMAAIENLCSLTILLNRGEMLACEETSSVIQLYLDSIGSQKAEEYLLTDETERSGTGLIRFTSFHIENSKGEKIHAARSGGDVVFVLGYRCAKDGVIHEVDPGISIGTMRLGLLVNYSSYSNELFTAVNGYGEFRFSIQDLPLASGTYQVGARVTVKGEEADWPRNEVGYLEVEPGDFFKSGRLGFSGGAPLLMRGKWEIKGREQKV